MIKPQDLGIPEFQTKLSKPRVESSAGTPDTLHQIPKSCRSGGLSFSIDYGVLENAACIQFVEPFVVDVPIRISVSRSKGVFQLQWEQFDDSWLCPSLSPQHHEILLKSHKLTMFEDSNTGSCDSSQPRQINWPKSKRTWRRSPVSWSQSPVLEIPWYSNHVGRAESRYIHTYNIIKHHFCPQHHISYSLEARNDCVYIDLPTPDE